ncbi:alcohol acetyltransferase [Lipomyces kononenkoae]|uniref:Alcohol acetyltransferase n=1 Tax=Lipomyces kononenkoae TaxID=34357 RepID=A0ACC3SUB5_LIPKO
MAAIPEHDALVWRPAGLLETYFATRTSIDYYTSVCVWTKFNRPVEKSRLYPAMHALIGRNPALSTVVLDSKTKSIKFALAKEIDLDKMIEYRSSSGSFEEFLAELHDIRFTYDTMTPVWKLFVWNENTVAFVFDHAPFDGVSGALFHVQLANLLNDQSAVLSEELSPIVNVDQSTKLAPALESIVSTSPPLWFVARMLLAEFGPKWGLSEPAERYGNIFAPYTHPVEGTTYRILEIPAERVKVLLHKCRAHNTTMTGLFHTMLLMGMSKAYIGVRGFQTSVPINARRFLSSIPDAANEMGAFVFKYQEVTAAQEEFSWDEVIRFANSLRKGTTRRAGYNLGMLKYLFGNISGWMEAKIGKVRQEEVMELSNLGVWKFSGDVSHEDEFAVMSMGFSQPHGTLNPPICLSSVGVVGGGVTLTLRFSDKIAGHGKGDLVFDLIKKMVDELSEKD